MEEPSSPPCYQRVHGCGIPYSREVIVVSYQWNVLGILLLEFAGSSSYGVLRKAGFCSTGSFSKELLQCTMARGSL